MTIKTAMVLAAGLGTRMAPLTDTMPKPMVSVAGRPIIDHILDKLVAAGVQRAVVNVHYMADPLESHLAGRSDIEIVISDERETLMDSGGGVAQALQYLGDEPFLVLNADALWVEGVKPALDRLVDAWDPGKMDGLMLIANIATANWVFGPG